MNKYILILLALLAVNTVSIAQSWNDGKDDNVMWKISDGDSELYILGSIHVGDDAMYPLDEEIYAAFDESEALVVELDQRKLDQQTAMKYMLDMSGKKLSEKISPENFQKISQTLGMLMPLEQIEMLKPWAAGLTMQMMKMQQVGMNPSLGIDMHFLEKADKKKLPIEQLETAEFQFSLFDKLGENPDALLMYLDEEMEKKMGETIKAMTTEWSEGDIDDLKAIIDAEMENMDNESAKIIQEDFFLTRNKNMAAKIQEYLKENKKYFVIAGAGHMIGEGGIVDILEKSDAQYTFTRY